MDPTSLPIIIAGILCVGLVVMSAIFVLRIFILLLESAIMLGMSISHKAGMAGLLVYVVAWALLTPLMIVCVSIHCWLLYYFIRAAESGEKS